MYQRVRNKMPTSAQRRITGSVGQTGHISCAAISSSELLGIALEAFPHHQERCAMTRKTSIHTVMTERTHPRGTLEEFLVVL
jgi:hypothetical protein